jgi:hypothetical protein
MFSLLLIEGVKSIGPVNDYRFIYFSVECSKLTCYQIIIIFYKKKGAIKDNDYTMLV